MKTFLIVLVIVVVIALIAVAVIAVAAGRFGMRSYQRYSGIEQQRASAKQSRVASVDRLKQAERDLIQAQRALIASGKHEDAQALEQVRVRLSTAADRHRFATHGYAPLHSPNPVREEELAELQARDADSIDDAQLVSDSARKVAAGAADGQALDVDALRASVEHFIANLDRRGALG